MQLFLYCICKHCFRDAIAVQHGWVLFELIVQKPHAGTICRKTLSRALYYEYTYYGMVVSAIPPLASLCAEFLLTIVYLSNQL